MLSCAPLGDKVSDKKLSTIFDFLCEATRAEIEKNWVELLDINAGGVPAAVIVGRLIFSCHEAAIQVEGGASRTLKRASGSDEPDQQPLAAEVPAKRSDNFLPSAGVDALWKGAGLVEGWNQEHNTIVVLTAFNTFFRIFKDDPPQPSSATPSHARMNNAWQPGLRRASVYCGYN